MKAVQITAVLRESASCGAPSRADYRQQTLPFVPGSVLRGALAAAWLHTPGAPRPTEARFVEVFEGEGTFGPLHSLTSAPVPLSVWVHKHTPKDTCSRRWWDEAYDERPDPGNETCPDCGGDLELAKGQSVGTVDIVTRTRVALDLDGVAKPGNLFRRSALAADTVLRGWVSGPAVDALQPAGQRVTTVRFGGERSVRGLAEITIDEDAPAPQAETAGNDVILRLASPALFLDRFGLPADRPGKPELQAALGVRVDDIQAWNRWTEVGGWHAASGLPKPSERAVAAGSTYRIRCAQPPPGERLSALMLRGLGWRRREGFGFLYPRPRDWQAETFPILGWRKWPTAAPLFRGRANELRQGRPDNRLDKVTDDPTLTRRQRQALATLLSITDPTVLDTILDGLSR